MLTLKNLTCNHEFCPLSVDGTLKFSWQLVSDQNDTYQRAFRISIKNERCEEICNTGETVSDKCVDISLPALKTQPCRRYHWELQVWDNHENTVAESSFFETAPITVGGKWIEASEPTIRREKPVGMVAASLFHAKPKLPPEERLAPVTLFRKPFEINKPLKYARLYATTHGIYRITLNGKPIDNRYFSPEFTAYQKVLLYQTFDVTEYLQAGKNACGIMVADGWWGGRIGMSGECAQYGDSRSLLMELRLVYSDDSEESICTDETFAWSDESEIRYSDLFIGEMQDHRFAEKTGHFDLPEFCDDGWRSAVIKNYGKENLKPQTGPAVRIFRTFDVMQTLQTPKGETVLDFGQNIAGFVRVTADAPANTRIVLEHSEVMDEKGNYINNIMGVNKDQKDIFICSGKGPEVFEPVFTFHGFRYVRITCDNPAAKLQFRALALSSAMENAAEFSCSNELLNRLYSNVRYSQYANMISIPTDCPQREKAGWTGDIQVYAPTACFHQDMQTFLERWLQSMRAEQFDDGQIPNVIPYNESYRNQMISVFHEERSAGWGDACIIVPWVLYCQYGDRDILEQNWQMMTRWMNYIQNQAETQAPKAFSKKKKTPRETDNQKYLWNTGWHFGDWLIPSYSKSLLTSTKSGKVTKDIIAPAYYAYTTGLMAKIAGVLGKEEEELYRKRQMRIREAFAETYVSAGGRITPDLQGLYVCALWFDLIPKDLEKAAFEHLLELIDRNNGCLDTGFLATPLLLDVMCKYGRRDKAYDLLYQERCPSWLYEVKNGATTIWENWQAIRPNGKVSIYSYNHYATGCVFDWIYRNVNGINSGEAGYHKIKIAPVPDEKLTRARAVHECRYGRIISDWRKDGDTFILEVELPCNTSAEIRMPDGTQYTVGNGKFTFKCGIKTASLV